MYKDLRIVKRESREKPGMREFFILILVYSYFNNRTNTENEFILPQSCIANYFKCSTKTVYRWYEKLRDLGFLTYAKRENAGKIGQYAIIENDKKVIKSYTIPKYKRIRRGQKTEIKFTNIYILQTKKLNEYLKTTINLDIMSNIKQYQYIFNDFIKYLSSINNIGIEEVNNIESSASNIKLVSTTLTKKQQYILTKIDENKIYLDKKKQFDSLYPEFKCRYLEEGSLRLTSDICNTLNPEHIDKVNENNYWKSSQTRNNMLMKFFNTQSINDIIERDVNGSIYRLTYNLNHDTFLDISQDIYQLIWNNCNFDCNISVYKNNRDIFKKILMPIYMKESTIKYRASHWTYIDTYYSNKPRSYSKLSTDDRNFYEQYKIFIDSTKLTILEFLTRIKESMHKTLNTTKFIGSEIFIYESNLHILIREKFLNKGIECINVYDGFYFKKSKVSPNTFNIIYHEALTELKDNLRKSI